MPQQIRKQRRQPGRQLPSIDLAAIYSSRKHHIELAMIAPKHSLPQFGWAVRSTCSGGWTRASRCHLCIRTWNLCGIFRSWRGATTSYPNRSGRNCLLLWQSRLQRSSMCGSMNKLIYSERLIIQGLAILDDLNRAKRSLSEIPHNGRIEIALQ